MTTPIELTCNAYFVTGTDTDVGKTVCVSALLNVAHQQKLTTIAYKPISAGCEETLEGLRNEDALILQRHSQIDVAYDLINPIAFKPAIAPHIAAEKVQQPIQFETIDQGFCSLTKMHADLMLVEGAGGWHLPINHHQLLSDWVAMKGLPVILVVGLKLGCLNHALLTVQAIQQSGVPLAGWIANHTQQTMPYAAENVATLKSMIAAPLLAEVPFKDDIDKQDLSSYFNVNFK